MNVHLLLFTTQIAFYDVHLPYNGNDPDKPSQFAHLQGGCTNTYSPVQVWHLKYKIYGWLRLSNLVTNLVIVVRIYSYCSASAQFVVGINSSGDLKKLSLSPTVENV